MTTCCATCSFERRYYFRYAGILKSSCHDHIKKDKISNVELWEKAINEEVRLKNVGRGVTGSKFAFTIKDGQESPQAILKTMNPPKDSMVRQVEKAIKNVIGQDRPTDNLVNADVRMKMVAEIACAMLARDLGFNQAAKLLGRCGGGYDIVPPTRLVACENRLQSMQVYPNFP